MGSCVCKKLCDDIEGTAIANGVKSDNVTESDALASCNKSRDIIEEAQSCGLTSRQSPGRRPGMIVTKPGTTEVHPYICLQHQVAMIGNIRLSTQDKKENLILISPW
jgi:hypothetical protein